MILDYQGTKGKNNKITKDLSFCNEKLKKNIKKKQMGIFHYKIWPIKIT